MKEIRYQNILLTIPSGATADQLREASAELDRGFNRITGIQANVVNSATLSNNLLIGARSNRRTWVDQIPVAGWNANDQAGVAPDAKFMDVNIPYGSGDTFYLQATPLASPGADVEIYMTLRLEADLTEQPK